MSSPAWAVVRNGQGQHSVYPADVPPPTGWQVTGSTGSRADCLSTIATEWNDLRPLTVQQRNH